MRLALLAALLAMIFSAGPVRAECEPYPVGPDSPTGIVGCEVYGDGVASMWGGPGVARNDCVYPWETCAPILITVIETGVRIEIRPTMYCDCYSGTANQRIVDLDPNTVLALGLNIADGLWRVRVEPAGGVMLPNTAMPAP